MDGLPNPSLRSNCLGTAISVCMRAGCSATVKGLGAWRELTKHLEALLVEQDLSLPDHLTGRIQPRPRNPDLAAYRGKKWHFCEVKFNLREQVAEEQLVALAVLQKLLGATVEVVRVVDEQYRGLKV